MSDYLHTLIEMTSDAPTVDPYASAMLFDAALDVWPLLDTGERTLMILLLRSVAHKQRPLCMAARPDIDALVEKLLYHEDEDGEPMGPAAIESFLADSTK